MMFLEDSDIFLNYEHATQSIFLINVGDIG